jgi:ABC-2 type transport system permease protein
MLGTFAFASLGMALAGTLRAEATLAAANAIYVLLLLGGGVIVPTSDMAAPWSSIIGMLPSAALADGLRATTSSGGEATTVLLSCLILALWGAAGSAIVHRWFRWTS